MAKDRIAHVGRSFIVAMASRVDSNMGMALEEKFHSYEDTSRGNRVDLSLSKRYAELRRILDNRIRIDMGWMCEVEHNSKTRKNYKERSFY